MSGRPTSPSLRPAAAAPGRSARSADYVTKLSIACPVTATARWQDAVAALEEARAAVAVLLGRSLLEDCTDSITGELTPVIVVTDNGSCYKAAAFERYIASRPELTHVRTSKKSPHTNGVVECFNRVLKYEDLYRDLPADGLDLTLRAAAHRDLYNKIRPHEHLAWARPLEAFLAEPITPTYGRDVERCGAPMVFLPLEAPPPRPLPACARRLPRGDRSSMHGHSSALHAHGPAARPHFDDVAASSLREGRGSGPPLRSSQRPGRAGGPACRSPRSTAGHNVPTTGAPALSGDRLPHDATHLTSRETDVFTAQRGALVARGVLRRRGGRALVTLRTGRVAPPTRG